MSSDLFLVQPPDTEHTSHTVIKTKEDRIIYDDAIPIPQGLSLLALSYTELVSGRDWSCVRVYLSNTLCLTGESKENDSPWMHPQNNKSRVRRQTTVYEIETMMVADYSVYSL